MASEGDLEKVRILRGQMRDYHQDISWVGVWDILGVLMDAIASGVNATLIAKDHRNFEAISFSSASWMESKHPTVFPETWLFDEEDRTVEYIWRKYFNLSKYHATKMPKILHKDTMFHNFVYCGIKETKSDSNWSFNFLTNPIDTGTWLFINFVIVVISLMNYLGDGRQASFLKHLLTAISPLVQSGVYRFAKHHSGVFILWMFGSITVANWYIGDMTSQVIKPPPDKVITTWKELQSNNYTLIFFQKFPRNVISNVVDSSIQNGNRQNHVTVAKQMLSKSILHETSNPYEDWLWYSHTFSMGADKVAALQEWHWAIHHVGWAEDYIGKHYDRNSKEKKRKCHVGAELIRSGEKFVIFLPPGADQLGRIYERLAASGIVEWWYREMTSGSGGRGALRAQEWIRVKGKTTIVHMDGSVYAALKLRGKVAAVVLVWCIGILFSGACFTSERSIKY